MNNRLQLLRAFQIRPFAYLWSGQALSRVGDFVYDVALAWWVLQTTGSAAMMATVLIFTLAPTVIFSLIGGVVVDRYPRLPMMIGADIVRGLAALTIAALTFSGHLVMWHILSLSVIYGIVDAFFQPAYMTTVPAIVPDRDLSSANSLTSFSAQAGRVIGPPIGAGLIALGGTGLAFAINGLTFFASALFLLPLLRTEMPPLPADEQTSLIDDLKEGLQTVRELPWLWITIGVFALTNVALAGPYSVAMPFLVENVLNAEVSTLGLLYSMFAVGYVIGGIWLGNQVDVRGRGKLIYGGAAVAGVSLAVFGLPVGVPVLIVAALINGAALQIGALAWVHTMQDLVPREKLGRVSGVDNVGSLALLPVGFALAGLATEAWGPAAVFLIGGGAVALITLIAMRHPAIRSLD